MYSNTKPKDIPNNLTKVYIKDLARILNKRKINGFLGTRNLIKKFINIVVNILYLPHYIYYFISKGNNKRYNRTVSHSKRKTCAVLVVKLQIITQNKTKMLYNLDYL